MKNLIQPIILIVLVWVFISAHSIKSVKINTNTGGTHQKIQAKLFFEKYHKVIQKRLDKSGQSFKIPIDKFHYFDTLSIFYSQRNFKSLYSENIFTLQRINVILSYLRKSKDHGLDKEYYNYLLIEKTINDFLNTVCKDHYLNLETLASLELLISDALLRYSKHLQYGVFNPKQLDPTSYYLPVNEDVTVGIFEPLLTNDIEAYLKSIQPQDSRYIKLQQALKYYRTILPLDDGKKIIFTVEKIQINDTSTILDMIAFRLLLFGYLDQLQYDNMDVKVYDTILYLSIIEFQKNSGLLADGVIGKNTINALNTSVKERIEQIYLNLERFRWRQYPQSGQFVLVNIPDFHLYAFDNGEVKVRMKVCLGKRKEKNYNEKMKYYLKTKKRKYKPKNHETPTMHGQLAYFVLNPYWIVPKNIAQDEMYDLILRDTSYLTRKNLIVYYQDSILDKKTINWAEYKDEKLPFQIKQNPGSGNALGKIKFIFRNPFSIYLHDTPNKSAFLRSNRAVSHGCIRIEKPLSLTEFLICDYDKLDMDDILIELGYKPKDKAKAKKFKEKQKELEENNRELTSKSLYLKSKVDLFIDYYTCWVDEAGKIQFRNDVYNKDEILKNAFSEYEKVMN